MYVWKIIGWRTSTNRNNRILNFSAKRSFWNEVLMSSIAFLFPSIFLLLFYNDFIFTWIKGVDVMYNFYLYGREMSFAKVLIFTTSPFIVIIGKLGVESLRYRDIDWMRVCRLAEIFHEKWMSVWQQMHDNAAPARNQMAASHWLLLSRGFDKKPKICSKLFYLNVKFLNKDTNLVHRRLLTPETRDVRRRIQLPRSPWLNSKGHRSRS